MRYQELISELRRNPEQNRRSSPIEDLAQYQFSNNHYMSMTAIDKIGLNPANKYNTPIGVYTYQTGYAYDIVSEDGFGGLPYQGNQPFAWIIEAKDQNSKLDLNRYTKTQFNSDMKKLHDKIVGKISEHLFNIVTKQAIEESKLDSYGARLWNVTRSLSMILAGNKITLNNGTRKSTVLWNKILSQVLGYTYAVDNGGGIIHESEPTQAVFFSSASFKVVEKLSITKQKRGISNKLTPDKAINELIKKLENVKVASVNVSAQLQKNLYDHLVKEDNEDLLFYLASIKNLQPAFVKILLKDFTHVSIGKESKIHGTLWDKADVDNYTWNNIEELYPGTKFVPIQEIWK